MDPKQCFKNVIAGVPWGYLCLQTRFRNRCTDSVHLLQIKPALPTSKSLDYIASGLLGPTSGLPCQPANHWIPLLRAYSGLHRAYLCQPTNHLIPLVRAYSCLHRAYLANQQIIGFHCFGPTRAYLGPTLPTSKSLDSIASGLLGPTSGLPCQPANH